MRFLLRVILTAILAWILGQFLPFWSAALAAFIIGLLLSKKNKRRIFASNSKPTYSLSFLSGFLGVFILWFAFAFFIDQTNHSILSPKIAELVLQQPSSMLIIFVSGLIGGLLGGFGCMTGNLLGSAIKN